MRAGQSGFKTCWVSQSFSLIQPPGVVVGGGEVVAGGQGAGVGVAQDRPAATDAARRGARVQATTEGADGGRMNRGGTAERPRFAVPSRWSIHEVGKGDDDGGCPVGSTR
jgi:hypothetical protein